MTTVLRYKDKYASFELRLEDRIICAVVSGVIGNSFAERYNRDFFILMEQLGLEPWGHFADISNCEALTFEAQQTSKLLHHEAKNRGCILSTFQVNSGLLTSQLNSIRQDSELPILESQRFFATKSEAIIFIENCLLNATSNNKGS